jgi:quercetin dioxygenase-like cupin family protein
MHHRSADADWKAAPEGWFAKRAWFKPGHAPVDATDLDVLEVRFEPGARTHWHSHPGGQVIYVLEGTALVVTDDGERVVANAGDAVHAPAGELHWHGATADAEMRHLSITHGGPTEWADRPVTDADYLSGAGS